MKIQDWDNRLFICRDGEEITVKVFSKKTEHLVEYTLDKETSELDKGIPLVFDLNQAEADPSLLTMSFHFKNSTDGAYAVEIKGDASGETFTEIYRQNFIPLAVDHFKFDIWP